MALSPESSDDIEMAGLSNVTRAQVMEVMGGDIGRNVFFIPLDERQKQLRADPLGRVGQRHAFRSGPYQDSDQGTHTRCLRSSRVQNHADRRRRRPDGTLVEEEIFVSGHRGNESEPAALDSFRADEDLQPAGAANWIPEVRTTRKDLSEVDLSDPEDVKVLANDPDGEVLVHLGSSNYLDRFKIYVAHLREWRQQFPEAGICGFALRPPDYCESRSAAAPNTSPISAKAAESAAMAAGVKPAALVQREPASETGSGRGAPAKFLRRIRRRRNRVKRRGSSPVAKAQLAPHSQLDIRMLRKRSSPKPRRAAASAVQSSATRQTTATAKTKPSNCERTGQP